MEGKKLALTVALIVIVIGGGLWWYLTMRGPNADTPTLPSGVQEGTEITVEGRAICLPKRGSGPTTAECAYGIEDGNTRYSLGNLTQDQLTTVEIGQSLTVTGVVRAADPKSPYDIVGMIHVTVVSK